MNNINDLFSSNGFKIISFIVTGILALQLLIMFKNKTFDRKNVMKSIVIAIVITFSIGLAASLFIFLRPSAVADSTSWYLKSMKIEQLRKYAVGDSQVIAIIDTGLSSEFLKEHQEKIVNTHNVIDGTDNVSDEHGHGTEMASVACFGVGDTISGIAKESKIMIIKAVDGSGKTNNQYLNKSINYAIDNQATVINISIGGFKEDADVKKSIKNAIEEGITVVAAAGDYANKDLLFPASVNGVISVEAKTSENKIWEQSNTATNSVAAFAGTDIEVIALVDGQLIRDIKSGTSEAAAIASGYIALLRDYAQKNDIDMDNEKLIELLKGMDMKSSQEINYLYPFETLEKK